MRNAINEDLINNDLTLTDIEKFFNKSPTTENIHDLFSSGFPTVLLEADHFIQLLKRRGLWDETGACIIIDYTKEKLPDIICDNQIFEMFFRSLSQNVLSHLFSNADFIPRRFLSNFAITKTWLLDQRLSSDHRLFLFKFYQKDIIQSLQSKPFTFGILSTLLSFLENIDEKDRLFVKEIMLTMKSEIIHLFQQPNILPCLRYFLLSNTTNEEFTLLIREIPEIIELLCNIENPAFFPTIQFEKLSPELGATIQLQLIQNLIYYHTQQKGHPAFFTATYHPEDRRFISSLKKMINESEGNYYEKIIKIQNIINEQQASLSIYIKKLLADRQFSANTTSAPSQEGEHLSAASSF